MVVFFIFGIVIGLVIIWLIVDNDITKRISIRVYEHLKTRKKYNTLELKYDVKCEELEHKILELNTEKRIRVKQQEIFNERLQELIEQNLKLNEELLKTKRNIRELKKKKESD